jgi:hypothetical protein
MTFLVDGNPIEDGFYIARVVGGKLEVLMDTKTGRFVEVVVKAEREFSADFSSDFA